MADIFKNDEAVAFLRLEGFSGGYNDMLTKYLREYLGVSGLSLSDLIYRYTATNGRTLLTLATPILTHDFTGATLPTEMTFTRASAANYYNSSGVLTSAPTNTPRFDYNPSTLEIRGLMIEKATTNEINYSEEFDNAYWNTTRASVSANAVVAPDGTTTADNLVEDTDTGTHQIFNNTSPIPSQAIGTDITVSIYAKQGSGSRFLQLVLAGSVSGSYGVYDLSNITAANTVASHVLGSTILDVGNGWRRCSLTVKTTSTATTNIFIRLAENYFTSIDNYTGDGASSISIWGYQAEIGDNYSSYIKTTSAAASRAADVASFTGTNFSDWWNASEGTLVVKLLSGINYPSTVVSINDGTANETIIVSRTDDLQATITMTDGGVEQFSQVNAINGDTTINSHVFGYKANNSIAASNNVLGTLDTSCTIPTVTQLQVGTVAPAAFHLRSLEYYDVRLNDATIQSKSA